MAGFDRERVEALSAQLLAALKSSANPDAALLLAKIEPQLLPAARGELDAPVQRALGGKLFIEGDLPGDPVIEPLYSGWRSVVRGADPEREQAILYLNRRHHVS